MNMILWILQAFLGLSFLVGGYMHGFRIEQARTQMEWMTAVADNLLHFIGICEILGGIGLILPAVTGIWPKLTPWAAVGLATIMVLAALFHLQRQEYPAIAINIFLFVLAAFVAYGRFVLEPF